MTIRKKAIPGLIKGDAFTITRTFYETDVQVFADITKDYNPVHFDDRFAAIKGFKGKVCHGLLVAGMITEIGGQIGWLASGMEFSFQKPVYFNDTITCRFTITELDINNKAKAVAVFTNQDGQVVLEATLTGILPHEPEKKVMAQMVAKGDPINRSTP